MINCKKVLSNVVLSLGIIVVSSPFILYWFIHGNYERYIWIIRGTFPFNSFGSGPFQLFMYIGLSVIGVILIGLSILLKNYKRFKE
jgi:hypothetical protein